MVDTIAVIAGGLQSSDRITGRTTMSQRKTTVPPTGKQSRSSRSGREGLIAKEKTEKQSAKRRTALDNRFHRTCLANGDSHDRKGQPHPRHVGAHASLRSPLYELLDRSNR